MGRLKHLLTSPNFWTVAFAAAAVWVCLAGYLAFLVPNNSEKIFTSFLILTVISYAAASSLVLLFVKKVVNDRGRTFLWLFALVLGSFFFGAGSYFILPDPYGNVIVTVTALFITITSAAIFRVIWAVLEAVFFKNAEPMAIFDREQHKGNGEKI